MSSTAPPNIWELLEELFDNACKEFGIGNQSSLSNVEGQSATLVTTSQPCLGGKVMISLAHRHDPHDSRFYTRSRLTVFPVLTSLSQERHDREVASLVFDSAGPSESPFFRITAQSYIEDEKRLDELAVGFKNCISNELIIAGNDSWQAPILIAASCILRHLGHYVGRQSIHFVQGDHDSI